MDYFGLDDDARVIAETAAEFAEKRIAPYALEWDAAKHFPTDVLRAAAELGMAAIYCKEDAGGSGLHRLDGVRIFEQLAVADPTNPGPAAVRETGRLCYPSASRAVAALQHLHRYAEFRRRRGLT